MLFNSVEFLFLFLPIVLLGYWGACRVPDVRYRKIWLTLASLVFYGWWNPWLLLLLATSILGNFYCGGVVLAQKRQGGLKAARLVVITGFAFNIALLAYFKYAGFLLANLTLLTGWPNVEANIILPLAISFFTFQQIAYLADTFEGKVERYALIDFTLFVSFFPQLIAGPIVHHKELVSQFNHTNLSLRHENFSVGFTFLVIGLMKKILIADNIDTVAAPVFDSGLETPGLIESWLAVLSFTLGIYFDFSGYSDMAVGLARMFGVKLPYNFNSPYKSTSIIDFWRRWHITLSNFLRDYLYIPLGGNRRGQARRYINVFITMLLGGLWHGASWTFVAWGGLHGLFIIINQQWEKRFARKSVLGRPLSQALTLLVVMIAWVFFRAGSFDQALNVLTGMAGMNGWISEAIATSLQNTYLAEQYAEGGLANLIRPSSLRNNIGEIFPFFLMAVGVIVALFAPNSQTFIENIGENISRQTNTAISRFQFRLRWTPSIHWAAILMAGFICCITAMSEVKAFVYFQF